MSIEDKNGCLHSEKNGKFISKNKPYDSKDNFAELKKKVNKTTIKQEDEQIPRSTECRKNRN